MAKTFVTVTAEHGPDGTTTPIKFLWPDNRQYMIDRILDIRIAASLKGGGQGIRYTCRVLGRQIYLFCDEGIWFVEH